MRYIRRPDEAPRPSPCRRLANALFLQELAVLLSLPRFVVRDASTPPHSMAMNPNTTSRHRRSDCRCRRRSSDRRFVRWPAWRAYLVPVRRRKPHQCSTYFYFSYPYTRGVYGEMGCVLLYLQVRAVSGHGKVGAQNESAEKDGGFTYHTLRPRPSRHALPLILPPQPPTPTQPQPPTQSPTLTQPPTLTSLWVISRPLTLGVAIHNTFYFINYYLLAF